MKTNQSQVGSTLNIRRRLTTVLHAVRLRRVERTRHHESRSAGVPPAGSPSVLLGGGTGGETPPEPAAGDGRATLAPVQGAIARVVRGRLTLPRLRSAKVSATPTVRSAVGLNLAARPANRKGIQIKPIILALWGFLVLSAPGAAVAQQYEGFDYTNNGSAITITGYTGTNEVVTIPDTIDGLPVASIGTNAFEYDSFTSVTIPDSITSIRNSAFAWTGLTSISIPNSVTNIGDFALVGSPLTTITVASGDPAYSTDDGVLFDKSERTLIQYPPSARATSYTIPISVTNIGDSAFSECASLTSVTIPDGVTSIGDSAFSECISLTSFTIPNRVTSIANYAFYDCGDLTNVTMGDSVTNIGDGAFEGTGLTSITIPNSVTSVGDSAFSGCLSLTHITIPDSVTSIGDWTFANSRLTSITIPDSVTSIGDDAFAYCANLTRADFLGNAPSADATVFSGAHVTAYYLPGTKGWAEFATNTGISTALWTLPYPVVLNGTAGVQSNQFGFTVSWATNLPVVVEAATDLAHPAWSPVATNTLTGGTFQFSDPDWTNYPARFYRIRSQ